MAGKGERDKIALEMQGICKSFAGVPVLRDIDFDLRRGEVHVLVGENGAGKSTLMKILAGVYTSDSGKIVLEGNSVSFATPHEAQQHGVSTIFQELSLIPNLTVVENILLGREKSMWLPWIIDSRKNLAYARQLLAELDVDVRLDQPISELPSSKRQLVEIAKAISRNMNILIMDESTSSLSKREVDFLFMLIRKLTDKDISIIYISHRLEEIPRIGDRATVMRDGMVVDTLPVREGFDPVQLVELMVGKELSEKAKHLAPSTKPKGEAILQVRGLSRRSILQDIDFTLHRGEIVGLAGLVGSGRTELARAVFGADSIDRGAVTVDKVTVSRRSHRPAYMKSRGVAFLSEDRKLQGLFLNQTVAFNTSIVDLRKIQTSIGAVSRRMEKDRTREMIKNLDIRTTGTEQEVVYLSGGNQQKVLFARWLLSDSSVYILDEPTRGIDVGAKFTLFELMRKLAEQGAAILFISSELDELVETCDRIMVMYRGRLVADLPRHEAKLETILQLAFGLNCPNPPKDRLATHA